MVSCWISDKTEFLITNDRALAPVTLYSMLTRGYENLFPTLKELNIGFVAFSPLGNGFLSDRYTKDSKFEQGTDFRSFMPQFTEKGMEDDRSLLELVREMAEQKNATPAQISLAWMIQKKPWIVPIPGTRKPHRLVENLGTADIVLTAEGIVNIDKIIDGRGRPRYMA